MAEIKILVVEDELIVAQNIENILKQVGYTVPAKALSGEEAVYKTVVTKPDLILMDIDLKGDIDGIEAAEQIKSQFDVPVVFMTALSDPGTIQRAAISEPYGYVQKPFDIKLLRKTIDMALYKHAMDKKLAECEARKRMLISEIAEHIPKEERNDIEVERATMLTGLTSPIYAHLDLDSILKTACEETAKALNVTAVSVMLSDDNNHELSLAADIGLPEEFRNLHSTLPRQIYDELTKQVSPVAIFLNGDEVPCLPDADLYTELDISTVMVASMRYEDQLVGSLNVFSFDERRHFAFDDIGLMQKLADRVAQVIVNARELEETRWLNEQLELSYDAGLALNSLSEPHALLESLVQIVMAALCADQVVFYTFDASRKEVAFENGLGYSKEVLRELQNVRYSVREDDTLFGWIISKREPLLIPNVEVDPRYEDRNLRIGSVLGVPVTYNDHLYGVLTVVSSRQNAFSSFDIELLQRLASQAAVALNNADQLSELRRNIAELEAVNGVIRSLHQGQALDEMLPEFLDSLLTFINASFGSIWMYDATEGEMCHAVTQGFTSEVKRIKQEDNIVGHVHATREPYVSPEFRTDPLAGEELSALFPPEVGGVVLPFVVAQEYEGVCFVGVQRPRELTEDEIRLLIDMAEIAGIAIGSTWLLEKTARRLKRAQASQSIDLAISASVDLRFVLRVILDHVISQLRVDAADVLLLNMHTQTLEFAAGQGFQTTALQHTHLRLGQGCAGRAALEQRIIHVPDIMEEPNGFHRAPLLPNEKFVAYYAVPLIAKGQIKGVLELFHRSQHTTDFEWRKFLEAIAMQAAMAIDNAEMFDGLQRTNAELMLAYDTTLEGWSRALVLHDQKTENHTNRITEMATRLAREMGLRDYEEVHIRRGAILHDIGKMGIPGDILNKPGPLTDEEWEIMRQHPVFAYEMLSPISYLRPALDIPYCHHEKWDGTGYPVGLKGDQIPLSARIFAVVDVWDALLSTRPYRDAWPEGEVLSHIRAQSGTHFDPQAVEAFLQLRN